MFNNISINISSLPEKKKKNTKKKKKKLKKPPFCLLQTPAISRGLPPHDSSLCKDTMASPIATCHNDNNTRPWKIEVPCVQIKP